VLKLSKKSWGVIPLLSPPPFPSDPSLPLLPFFSPPPKRESGGVAGIFLKIDMRLGAFCCILATKLLSLSLELLLSMIIILADTDYVVQNEEHLVVSFQKQGVGHSLNC
jgi:hypothetical protein